jgi:hypothetical protein
MIGAADIGYESDVSSLTVIVPVAGTLAAASIAGGVALYIKRLERWNAAELRHSEEREKAYEAYLAACDRAWHLRIKGSVDRYKHRETIPEEKIELISESINQQAVSALEDLQRYSRNYERAGPVLFRLYSQAFEGRFTKPAAFEAARAAFQELQREETGLRKQLGLVRKASLREEFKMRREVRRTLRSVTTMHMVDDEGKVDEIIHQGDGEAIWYLLQQNMREWEELEQSVTRQESRSVRW